MAPRKSYNRNFWEGKPGFYEGWGEWKTLRGWVQDDRCKVALKTLTYRVKHNIGMLGLNIEEAMLRPGSPKEILEERKAAARAQFSVEKKKISFTAPKYVFDFVEEQRGEQSRNAWFTELFEALMAEDEEEDDDS